ncbi:MAG: ArnT family glycosyltransferase [Candidatus Aenigmatarchaeota archaeon]
MGFKKKIIIPIIFVLIFTTSLFLLNNIGVWRIDDALMFKFSKNCFGGQIEKEFYIKGFHTPYLPFLAINNNQISYRLAQSLFLSISGILIYLTALNLYNKRIGIITLLIILASPILIRFNGEMPVLLLYTSMIFYFIVKYYKRNENKFLYLASIILGFAISIKLLFIYVALSFLIASLILYRNRIRKINGITFFVTFLMILVGCSGFITLNIANDFLTLQYMSKNSITTRGNYNNLNILDNFLTRIYHTKDLLEIPSRFRQLRNLISNKIRFFINNTIFVLSSIFVIIKRRRKDLFLLTFMGLFLMMTIFIPTIPNLQHLAPLIPMIFILMSLLINELPKKSSYFLLTLIIIFNILTVTQVGYIINDEKLTREKIPHLSNVHKEVKKYIDNEDIIITVFPWQAIYLNNSYPEIDVKITPQEHEHNKGAILKINETEDLLKRSLMRKSKVMFIFPSKKRSEEEKSVYSWWCYWVREEKNLCVRPFSIFNNLKSKLNISCNKKIQVNGEFKKPVYNIYTDCKKK